ncbi:hypothetical protein [Paenibacillus thalictri]|uniref:Uncharacterized protein n=1 Tax=Paenibacillus thalictri TaxID=2527873 RepID=A0A4Q9DVH8_9BACL|nr:hypothetical protein [Paenibacillus thalictri]TBL80284.1 hypothetical protein EYB31_07655 [Paenibacillus thalictri]
MNWAALAVITVIVILMILYEWPRLRQHTVKEKSVFVIMTTAGWILALLLVLFPELPGPTQLVDAIYKPLGKLFE